MGQGTKDEQFSSDFVKSDFVKDEEAHRETQSGQLQ